MKQLSSFDKLMPKYLKPFTKLMASTNKEKLI